jgi:hypothetical protein
MEEAGWEVAGMAETGWAVAGKEEAGWEVGDVAAVAGCAMHLQRAWYHG